MSLLPVGFGASGDDYEITDSLRIRNSASASLQRFNATETNRRTFTYSGWFKLGYLNNDYWFQSARYNTSNFTGITINVNQGFGIYQKNSNNVTFVVREAGEKRDYAAWYHFVAAVDTTQSTSTNRVKLYVNGVLSISLVSASYPSQNLDTFFNTTSAVQTFAQSATTGNAQWDGYVTETHFIDGQQLTADDFGEYDANGTWKAKQYTGTYGTNGFYLNGVGVTDQSGNSNNWTNNNLNLSTSTAATYDQMKDTPSLVDADAANFATLNPLAKSSNANLSAGNLNYAGSSSTTSGVIGTIAVNSGKWYWEAKMTGGGGASMGIAQLPLASYGPNATGAYIYLLTGDKRLNNSDSSYGASYTTGDIIGVALDMDAGTVTFYKNNASQGTAFTGLSGNFTAWLQDGSTGSISSWEINFGQRPFAYTPPTGFLKLNTFNLPDSTIEDGSDYFNTVLYSGNSSTQSITGVGFQPDFVWGKDRTNVVHHTLNDAVRGVNLDLFSSSTSVESNDHAGLTAFTADGYNLSSSTNHNVSGHTYVGWNWLAGNSTSTSTAGSVNSTVSVNTTAGFSIATYTAPSSGSFTVGHGLGVAPAMIITKSRNNAYPWGTYHQSIGNTGRLDLNSTAATVTTANSAWQNTSPTSTVFTMGSGWAGSGITYVAYCFAPIEGYSAFGGYTGNGSTDGPFVYTGFRPAFVITKRTNSTSNWPIHDDKRSPYNVTEATLYANAADAEVNPSTEDVDFLSNGFKMRGTTTARNSSGSSYIYMAFAENPFKNALAR